MVHSSGVSAAENNDCKADVVTAPGELSRMFGACWESRNAVAGGSWLGGWRSDDDMAKDLSAGNDADGIRNSVYQNGTLWFERIRMLKVVQVTLLRFTAEVRYWRLEVSRDSCPQLTASMIPGCSE